jgi:hypothetical protein
MKTAKLLVLVLALCLAAFASSAQESQTKTKEGKNVTVTGCLQKGDEAGEYSVTGEDGKHYGLRSKSVDLSKHVGHKVTVTGSQMREGREEKEHAAGAEEEVHLRVTNIKHISESCQ